MQCPEGRGKETELMHEIRQKYSLGSWLQSDLGFYQFSKVPIVFFSKQASTRVI